MRRLSLFAAALAAVLVFVAPFLHAGGADEQLLKQKADSLCQKGQRAELLGELDEAVLLYQEAHEVCPKYLLPLMHWSKALCKAGLHQKAEKLIEQIPIEKQEPALRCLLYLRLGKTAIMNNSLEKAGAAYSKALKADESSTSALIHLAVINQITGGYSRARELLSLMQAPAETPEERRLACVLSIVHGKFGKALEAAEQISEAPHGKMRGVFSPFLLFSALPLGLSGILGFIYYTALFGALYFLLSRISPKSKLWHGLLFVFACVCTMLVMQRYSVNELFIALMQDAMFIGDPVWVLPRVLIAGHIIAFALFVIFPAFHLIKPTQRPKRHEYYGIWFYCIFFMIFTLIFQSGASSIYIFLSLAATFILAFAATFFVPFGRFFIFKLAAACGLASIMRLNKRPHSENGHLSLTDAKILEMKAEKLLENESFTQCVLAAKQILRSCSPTEYFNLRKTMIIALIAREDYLEAKNEVNSMLQTFKTGRRHASALLYDAVVKCKFGDFAGVLKIIKSFSDAQKKALTPNEEALALYAVGCANFSRKEYVPAHIGFSKAFNTASLHFIKAEALVMLAKLDFSLNASEALIKHVARAETLSGGPKTAPLKLIIQSIAAFKTENQTKALELAKKACEYETKNSPALYWYGHLLCLNGDRAEAEALLEQMPVGSYDAECLMSEITAML